MDSNIRRRWENRWRCGRWRGPRQSICHLSGWIGSQAKAPRHARSALALVTFKNQHGRCRAHCSLGLALSVGLKMRRQFPEDKFLKDTGDGALTKLDQAVLPNHSMAIGLRIVRIRDGAGCEGPDHFRVIELPFLIVALANHSIGERVQNPRSGTTASLVEISGILFEEGRQYGASDERTGNDVTVRCTKALCIPFCALPVCSELVRRLVNSGQEGNSHKGEGIDYRPKGKLELLPGRKRSRIGDVGDVEIWNEAEHTLLLLLLKLLRCHFELRASDSHFRHGGGNS